jgi:hypothetical protein
MRNVLVKVKPHLFISFFLKRKKEKRKREVNIEDGCEQGWKREAGRPGSTTHDRGVFTIDGAVELVLGVSLSSCMFLEFGGEYGLHSYSARTHIRTPSLSTNTMSVAHAPRQPLCPPPSHVHSL